MVSKVKKGCLPGFAGSGDGGFRRFVIPASHLRHPLLVELLTEAGEAYGYTATRPLKLPCSTDDFEDVLWLITEEIF
uniref:Small auxin up regulated protein n=1 Tax=Kalanchoe fedtschenkoi TaxID=63787 RepID=A0A7N0RJT0_KALFE